MSSTNGNTSTTPGLHTRAELLRKAAIGGGVLIGGGLLSGGLAREAFAHDASGGPSDIDLLNYALTLEHLEATFYTQGLQKFSRNKVNRSGVVRRFGGRISSHVYPNLQRIRDHEQQHVQTLTSVIQSLGGTPVPPCTYNFATTAFTSVRKFLAVAQILENTGVMAYDGAIAYLEAAPLLTAGATIATVEARHASYLNLLNGDVPFPAAFDTPVAPQAICQTVHDTFIVECPFDLEAFCQTLPNTVIS